MSQTFFFYIIGQKIIESRLEKVLLRIVANSFHVNVNVRTKLNRFLKSLIISTLSLTQGVVYLTFNVFVQFACIIKKMFL